MLSEDKIKLMTGIAMFEKREGKHIFPVNRYFKGDYISTHLLRSFFSYTISFLLCVGVWLLYKMEDVFNIVDLPDLHQLAWRVGGLYVLGLTVYLILTAHIYSKRYDYGERGKRVYLAKLKRLEKRYDVQNKTR